MSEQIVSETKPIDVKDVVVEVKAAEAKPKRRQQ